MSRSETDGGGEAEERPIRKIDDATYGTPPANRWRRWLVRLRRWLLLDANRSLVAGLMSAGTFLVIVAVGTFGPVPVRTFLTAGISPGTVLVELLKVIVSVVVIVLSINQLVLSPGLGPVGDQEERYEATIDLRKRIEAHTGVRTSPTSPAHCLSVLLGAIADQAETLSTLTADAPRGLRDDVGDYAANVRDEARSVERLVSDNRFGRFSVTSASLRFAISEKVRDLRALRSEYDEDLSRTQAEAVDEMDDLLELYTVTREYLKTVFIRSEYIALSQGLLLLGLPAAVVTYSAAQLYSPELFPGQVLGFELQLLFVAGAVTVALSPFVLLIAYVFRLAAMSRSTLFVGPFAARSGREEQRGGP